MQLSSTVDPPCNAVSLQLQIYTPPSPRLRDERQRLVFFFLSFYFYFFKKKSLISFSTYFIFDHRFLASRFQDLNPCNPFYHYMLRIRTTLQNQLGYHNNCRSRYVNRTTQNVTNGDDKRVH